MTERLNIETGNVTDLFASNFARARDATAGCDGMVPFNGAMESRGLFYVAYRFQMYVV